MDSMFPLLGIAFIALMGLACFKCYFSRAYFSRARRILEHWALDNGYEILSSEYRWFFRGPFPWTTNDQAVYYVTLRTTDGRERHGWVRCGNWLVGVLVNRAEVRWDK
jgi:hypothetical protein